MCVCVFILCMAIVLRGNINRVFQLTMTLLIWTRT